MQPPPPTAPAGRAGWARRAPPPLLLGTLLALLLLIREPGRLLHPIFWAEDGSLFFTQAFNEGFFATVLRVSPGYQLLLPRLVAGVARFVPEQAPLLFNLVAFAVQLLPPLYLAGPRLAAAIPSPAARALAALLCVLIPASSETHVTLANAQWHLALFSLCVLFAAPPARPVVRALESLLLAVAALTGPFSPILLPLVAPRLYRGLRGAPRDHGFRVGVIVAAGAAVQVASALAGPRVAAAASWPIPGVDRLAAAVSLHALLNPLLGLENVARVHQRVPPAVHALGLAALAVLLIIAARERQRALLALGGLGAATVTLALVFPTVDPASLAYPRASQRYFLSLGLFVLLSLLRLALRPGPLRPPAALLLGATALFGIPADFRQPPHVDTRWADQIAVFRSLPQGTQFWIPSAPVYHGGILLQKSSPERAPSPLARLRAIPAPAAGTVTISRPESVFFGVPNTSYFKVTGWAIDGAALAPAAGVFVRIDEKLFPATYGLPARVPLGGREIRDCAFLRLIPIAEVGPGPHELSIVVLDRDGTGYFQPPPPRRFATEQFFPRAGG